MMPLCSQMTGVAKGLAGLGALFYVAYRVWQSLARAEPVDVFPLLRPFALGLCIMFFPTIVLGTLNSVMSPIVKGTHSILEAQTFDMNEYRAQKAGVRGDEAQSRDGLSGRQGVFRQQTGRIGGYGRDRGLRDVCRPGNVQHEEGGSEFLPRTAGTHVQRGRPCHRHAADVLPDCAFDTGTDFVRPVLLGRFPGLAQPMVRPLYQHLPVAPGE